MEVHQPESLTHWVIARSFSPSPVQIPKILQEALEGLHHIRKGRPFGNQPSLLGHQLKQFALQCFQVSFGMDQKEAHQRSMGRIRRKHPGPQKEAEAILHQLPCVGLLLVEEQTVFKGELTKQTVAESVNCVNRDRVKIEEGCF